ncbi:MAG TPA: hypothetical protein VMI10_03155 [Terriglobales bacterium]|nr:hypothetical protein [Terriglobales bacterium]
MSKLLARLLTPSLAAASIMISAAYAVDQGTTQPHPVHRKAHKKAPPPLVLPPLPPGPLQQLPMADLPASTPKVTYENGLLTIGAQNATLGDVLREVHKLTGANIDVPPTGANERVVVQLGPGAPRDVLAALLNGTSFNYVLLGSATDAKAVATVTLSPRPSTGGGEIQTAVNTPAATPIFQQQMQQQAPMPSRPFFRGQNPPQPAAAASDDDSSDDDADDKDDSDDSGQAQPQQPGQMVQPGQQPDGSQDPNGTPNAGPRTPEQILQMIRDRQQPGAMGVPPGQQQPPQD